jgi:methylglutaconyl-CoA hydratase
VCHRLGAGHAARLLMTSKIIDAAEAARLGIFHELVPTDKVWARSIEIARECAAGAPEALQLTKRLLNETIGEQLETQLTTGAIMQATSFTTEAAQKGIAAFLDQRQAEWE